ncbi:hypothetical protein [Aporhodopirellula rubra]|nr:hypothetical protein [Aporhodopirellula rubra]
MKCSRGLGEPELLGRPMHPLMPFLPAVQGELPIDLRVDAVHRNGRQFPVQVSISEFPSQTDSTRIAIVRELTEAEKAEQERITMAQQAETLRAQQMTTLSQLLAGVTHEVRSPLTLIKMLVQVNRAKFAADSPSPRPWTGSVHARRLARRSSHRLSGGCRYEIGNWARGPTVVRGGERRWKPPNPCNPN